MEGRTSGAGRPVSPGALRRAGAGALTLWKKIAVLRGVAILCVVFNHSVLYVRALRMTPPLDLVPYGGFEKATLIFGVTFPIASIAGFMVASGFLMARFSATWPATVAAARSIAGRYVGWSLLGFGTLFALSRRFTVATALERLRSYYGPFPAYWFFSSLLLFALMSPLLVRWGKRRPWAVFSLFVALETVRAVVYYGGVSAPWLTPLQGSYFILGTLLSTYAGPIFERLNRHRRAVGAAALALLVVAWVETLYWWGVHGSPTATVISADRLSVRIYALVAVAWFLLQEIPASPLTAWLDGLGMKSLAIFLTFDLFQNVAMALAFRFIGGTGSGPPALLTSPLFVGGYFVVGISGPLAAVALTERLLSKRWKRWLWG